MHTNQDADFSPSAARNTLLQGVYLIIIGNPLILALLSARDAHQRISIFLIAHMVIALGVGGWLVFYRDPKPRTVNIVDALLIIPYFFTIWFSQDLSPQINADWLFAPKLLAFGLAIVLPGPASYRFHLGYVACLGLETLVIWWNQLRLGFPLSDAEPWFTILAFWMAISLTVLRQRQRRFEHQVVELQTRNEVLTEIAVVFLRVRDLANTPLQNLSLTADLLERGKPVSPDTAGIIKRSVGKLQTLFSEFHRYEDKVKWTEGHLSFEPEKTAGPKTGSSEGKDI